MNSVKKNINMKKKVLLLFYLFITHSVISQENETWTFKTTEEYYIEFPNEGDYLSKSILVTWVFFIDTKFIRFTKNGKNYIFDYYKNGYEIIKSKEGLTVINFENSNNEMLTLIKEDNYIKIKYLTDMEKLPDGSKSYNKVSVFTNYDIDGLFNLLSNEL
jgi:Zn/Cd-binding protein ZinT